jgi:hypothetical protein
MGGHRSPETRTPVARALLHRREWIVKPFGVMFAPNQALAARELLRVVRRGGVIGLANWTPEGFIGRLLVTIAKYVPPPVGVASPIYWGNEARLEVVTFGCGTCAISQ